MKLKFYITVFFISLSIKAQAQKPSQYPEAPERWSKPEPIKVILEDDSIARADAPTVTADGKTLYFGGWGGNLPN